MDDNAMKNNGWNLRKNVEIVDIFLERGKKKKK